jgi:hypothetical protein
MTYKPDQRDATKAPPAMLDPRTILKARRWLFTKEGAAELKAMREKTDWSAVK